MRKSDVKGECRKIGSGANKIIKIFFLHFYNETYVFLNFIELFQVNIEESAPLLIKSFSKNNFCTRTKRSRLSDGEYIVDRQFVDEFNTIFTNATEIVINTGKEFVEVQIEDGEHIEKLKSMAEDLHIDPNDLANIAIARYLNSRKEMSCQQ
jgi:hypothetical protein